jgi:hypothetical protein
MYLTHRVVYFFEGPGEGSNALRDEGSVSLHVNMEMGGGCQRS